MGAGAHSLCVLLLTALVILCLASSASGDKCTQEYEVTVRERSYSYVWRTCWYYRPCRYYWYWWWYHFYWRYWHCRYSYQCRRYRVTYSYKIEKRTRTVCCEGYKGRNCDIPICAECLNNGVCIAPDECSCPAGTTGNTCELATCSADNDCYPGSCNSVTGKCTCSSGFTGTNCQIMKEAGTLRECSIQFQNQVYATEFSGKCGQDEYGRTLQYYTNITNPYWLVANYEVFYDTTDDLPGFPSWMKDAPLGLTESSIKPYLYDQDGTLLPSNEDLDCNVVVGQGQQPPSAEEPYLTLNCEDTKTQWDRSVAHNYKLLLEISSTSGGFKRYLDERHNEHTVVFEGKTDKEEVIEILFDLEPPVHCKTTQDCTDENENPCEFYPDITKHGSVLVEWDGWKDDDSGLDSFSYTVYKVMKEAGQLVEGEEYIPRTTLSFLDSMPDVSVETPGLYSIILEVADAVGNIAKARSLLLYDNSSRIEVIRENPLSISGATLEGSNYWIVSPQSALTINWNKRYINRFLHDNDYLMGVKGMADVMDDEYGNFTAAKIRNVQGVSKFGVHVSLEDKRPEESEFQPVDIFNPTYVSSISQNSGTVIYVYVYSEDILGNSQVEYVPIGVDTTEVILKQQDVVFTKNDDVSVPGIPYVSSVSIPVGDSQSGILSINYTVIDYTSGQDVVVINDSQVGQQHGQHSTEDDCKESGECYCASLGGCFNNIQKLWLKNCAFEGLDGRAFKINYDVFNGAGMVTTNSYNIGMFDKIEGLKYYPAPHKVQVITHEDAFYKVTLTWEYLPSCYQMESMILTYTTSTSPITETATPGETVMDIDNLLPNREYTIEMQIHYTDGTKSEMVSVVFTTNDHPDNAVDTGKSDTQTEGLSSGGIAGIVIVGLIVILLVATVIVLLVRRKQNKPMVPPVVRDAGSRIRDRMSRFSRAPPAMSNTEYYREDGQGPGSMYPNKAYDNAMHQDYARPMKAASVLGKPPPYDETFKVAYVGADDDDIYIYGNMDTDDDATWKVSNDRLVLGDPLPNVKGKFADLKLATLQTDGGSKTVVAKMNKVGATDIEKLLMKAKMNFLATEVPVNENLLQFVAAVPPPQGPMILMEYCSDGKLSDWLNNKKKVTDDMADSMINFSLQVAAGMSHLHNHSILHRRLGARNILLTMNMSRQLVAKVTGFGPMKGEQEAKSGKDKTKGDRVPFKWMAPEQFEVQPQGRLYTPKTDVWSYGILLHEIFSKGNQPYPDMSVSEVKDKVAKGYRMPKEPDCADFMYDDIMAICWANNAEDRPTFDMIHSGMRSFFQGEAGQEDYVYDAN